MSRNVDELNEMRRNENEWGGEQGVMRRNKKQLRIMKKKEEHCR
jgi:hypothetical protein